MPTIADIADIVARPPSPYDDLITGIRTLSHHYWNTPDIPPDVRDRMREWVQQALELGLHGVQIKEPDPG
jgi:hypothetical protein